MEVLIIIGILLLIGGGIVVGQHFEKKRTAQLLEFAEKRGFTFEPFKACTDNLISRNLGLFNRGRSNTVRNIIVGKSGTHEMMIFDYTYVAVSGKNRKTYHTTVVQFSSKDLALPAFSLRPEQIFHKIGNIFGYQDIDFSSNPDFSRQYILRGLNENEIRRIFVPETLNFFSARPGASIEAEGNTVIVYRDGSNIPPGELPQFLRDAEEALSFLS